MSRFTEVDPGFLSKTSMHAYPGHLQETVKIEDFQPHGGMDRRPEEKIKIGF